MKKIALSGGRGKGKYAFVDDWRYDELTRHSWHYMPSSNGKGGYAARGARVNNRYVIVLMHRQVAGAKPNEQIDHVDGDKLNCQEHNLRLATNGQNQYNTGKRSHNTSGYKGVTWSKRAGRWMAQLHYDYKHIHGGYWLSLDFAVLSHSVLALIYHGDFAHEDDLWRR